MIKKLFYLFAFCFLIVNYSTLLAQDSSFGGSANTAYDLPTIIPPSPTVSNLMQFEEIPVDNVSGIPNISIPLYSGSLDQNIVLNLGLSYHPDGIRVDNRSGWTGTGWSLTGLGAVSRTVLGIPDEHSGGVLSPKPGVMQYYDYAQDTTTDASLIDARNKFLYEVSKGFVDSEPDIFQFNAFGISGKFIILDNQAHQLGGNQQLKIAFQTGSSTSGGIYGGFSFSSFSITDQYGYTYVFEQSGRETTYNYPISVPSDDALVLPEDRHEHSAWNLTKVRNQADQVLLQVIYTSVMEEYDGPKTYIKTTATSSNPDVNNPQEFVGPVLVESYSEITTTTKKPSQIIIRNSNLIKIDFNHLLGHPEYKNGTGSQLSHVEIKERGNLNKYFDLSYSTSASNRLMLDSITEGSQDKELPYLFAYNDSPGAFDSYGKDIWGYANGRSKPTGTHPVVFMTDTSNRNVNPFFATKGILENITYPSGGVKEFDFETNRTSSIGGSSTTFPVNREFTSTVPTNLYEELDLGTINLPNSTNTIVTVTVRDIDMDKAEEKIQFTMQKSSQCNNTDHCYMEVHFDQTTHEDGTIVGQPASYTQDITSKSKFLSAGNYVLKLHNFYGNHIIADEVIVDVDITTFEEEEGDPNEIFINLKGGVRIKEIRFSELDNNNLVTKTRVGYEYNNFDNPLISSGNTFPIWGNTREDYEKFVIVSNGNTGPLAGTEDISSIYVSSVSSVPRLIPINGGYVLYDNVTVSQYDNDTPNGKTQYTYSPLSDASLSIGGGSIVYAPAPTKEYFYGNLLKQEVFDNNQRILSSTANEYVIEETVLGEAWSIRFNKSGCPVFHRQQDYGGYKNSICNNNTFIGGVCLGTNADNCDSFEFLQTIAAQFSRRAYNLYSGRALMENSTTTSYFYDSNYNQTSSVQTNNYSYNSFNNRISEHSVITSDQDTITTKYYYPADEEVNDQDHIDDLLDDHRVAELVKTESFLDDTLLFTELREFESFSNTPRLESIKTQKNEGSLEDRVIYHDYDVYGNPLEISKADSNSHIIYIWGYNSMYPIAQISNASYSDIDSSFITNIQNASNNDDDTTLGYSGNEGLLRQKLDELRNLPALQNSLMTSYTYDPIVGMTSQTDPRGYTMYYEYDDLNRLEYVKDSDGNILSENKYNYRTND